MTTRTTSRRAGGSAGRCPKTAASPDQDLAPGIVVLDPAAVMNRAVGIRGSLAQARGDGGASRAAQRKDGARVEGDWDEAESAARRRERHESEVSVSTDSVRTYLNKIGRVALLSGEQEVKLARRIETGLYAAQQLCTSGRALAGDNNISRRDRDLRWIVRDGERAKNHLLEANLRLVVSLARRYMGRGLAFLDLIQEGNLGLIHAVEKFDYAKGFKFSTYATGWIRQGIIRAIAGQARTIRLPVHTVEIVNKLRRLERELALGLGREPTIGELAGELDTSADKVLELQRYAREPLSLQHSIGDEGQGQLAEFIEDRETLAVEDAVAFTLLQEQLRSMLGTLSEREAGMIRLRHGLTDGQSHTLDEIAKVYGVSRERVRQIELHAMTTLRRAANSRALSDYLD